MANNMSIAYLITLKDRYTDVAKRVAQANEKIRETVGSLDQKLSSFTSSMDNLKGRFQKVRQVGMDAFVGWSVPVGLAIGGIVKLGAELEDTRIGMTTMLGSAEKANKLIANIRKMGAETPFESQDLLRNAKMLLNFGVGYNDVMKDMQMLGDISGGNKERFNALTLAFSQMSSQGRLMGQDLLQMVGAGFNPLYTISKKTGKSMGELKDIMSKGGISSAMVVQAMRIETEKGGRFYQYMAKNSKTFNGLMSTLSDNIKMVSADIGEKLLPTLKPFVNQLIGVTAVLGKLSPQTLIWILGLTGLSALLPVLMVGIGFLGQAFLSFNMTMTLIGSGFTSLIGIIPKFIAGLLFMSDAMTMLIAKELTFTEIMQLMNLTFLTSPVFLIVAGLVALVAVLVIAYQKVEWFRNIVQMLWIGLQILWDVIKIGAIYLWKFLAPALQTAWTWMQQVGGAIANMWAKLTQILKPVIDFGKFIFLWMTPLGLVINAVMILVKNFDKIVSSIGKAKDVMSKFKMGMDEGVAKAEAQIKSEQIKNQSTVNGEIRVKAENGSSVTQTKMKIKGKNANIGLNRGYTPQPA